MEVNNDNTDPTSASMNTMEPCRKTNVYSLAVTLRHHP